MPRLFTALEIPSTVALQLSLLQSGLPGARWIDRENLHLTLRFVGDVDGHQANELAEALEHIKTPGFELELNGLDVFGGSRPRSLFASIKRSDPLRHLQSAQERICQRIGLGPESRRFTPHVTIARVRGTETAELANYLSRHGGFTSIPFAVSRFVLLSSRASVGGGPYVVEETYQLAEQSLVES